jgi:tetratricopeptide (TPR) repeat protein
VERPELKVIRGARAQPAARPVAPRVPLLLGIGVLIAAVAASALGADRARVPVESKDLAKRTLLRALDHGPDDPEVRRTMTRLRSELGRRPLAARARSAYAVMLLGVGRGPDDLQAPLFHARTAARTAPVTVPVVRDAANVLVRGGARDDGLALARDMFAYDPEAAARVLGELEPFLSASELAGGIPDEPRAWLSWSRFLRRAGREADAEARLADAHDRWPADVEVLRVLARWAHDRADWELLARVLPTSEAIPASEAESLLHALRARARFERGDPAGARQDVETALRLGESHIPTLITAAPVLERLGDEGGAGDKLRRALFLLGSTGRNEERLVILVRLARAEERRGAASRALRAWRSVLEISPEHVEAQRRIDALTGVRR